MTSAHRGWLDGATVEVVRSYLNATAQEMRVTLIRTAFGVIIYEARDFGLSIYDANLQLIAESTGLTMFLGANDHSIRKGVEYVGVDNLEPGDVLLLNYPYWNGAHTYDTTVFAPVFEPEGSRPIAYLCVRAHWMDLGAKDAGYVVDSTDMHQEGVVFPGTKIVTRGQPNEQIFELLRFNSRTPEIVLGDLHAQIAALRTGERRLLEIVGEFGPQTFEGAVAAIIAHGETTTARELAALPHGSWTAVDYLDDDGITDDPIRMQATVTISDESFEIDFAGSASATAGPVNMPFGTTLAMCRVAFKALTSPTEPSNAGHYRALTVRAEPGTLFHAVYPAPTFTLWAAIAGLELIFKALAQAMPERCGAGSGGDVPGYMVVGQHPQTGALAFTGGNDVVGRGAMPARDGVEGFIHLSESAVRNTPIEVMEADGLVMVERLEFRTDSGGPGRFRGGAGVERHLRFLSPGAFLTVAKRTKTRPWALDGGTEPEPNTIIMWPGTEREQRMSTRRVEVRRGDRVWVLTAGGGGYGDPRGRQRDRILADVADGYVSPEAARDVYGVD